MFVRSLLMRDFRGIRRVRTAGEGGEEAIELAKFNVLVGPNNSGKSTVLEALSLLPHPLEAIDPITGRHKAGFIYDFLHGDGSGACLVYRYYGRAELSYVDGAGRHLQITIRKEFGPLHIEMAIDGWSTDGHGGKAISERLGLDYEREFHSSVMFFPGERENRSPQVARGYLSMLWSQLFVRGDLWRLIERVNAQITVARDVLSPALNEELVELLQKKDGLYVRKVFPDGTWDYIRVEDLGDGVEKVLAALVVFEALKPKLILWDDLEASLHPNLLRAVLAWLAECDWQVVLATHSVDVLYRLLDLGKDARSSARVIMLQKTPDDVLLWRALTMDELEDLMLLKQDPRLVAGALGL